jgi:demethylmenaquinone methyltransferase/2-methoxy-6-polyprenyl-1,4-benzoquinol methylase
MNHDLILYYARRAAEYERHYETPARAGDLATLKALLRPAFAGRDVLEVACGTGYWTQAIAASARSIVGVDANVVTLDIARRKSYASCPVSFAVADAYDLADVGAGFTGGLCAFWLSHVPRRRLAEFFPVFHARLSPGALVIALDAIYVHGQNTPISRTDANGDTYQSRTLADGSLHEVLKNFLLDDELKNAVGEQALDLELRRLEYYWLLRYRLG